VSLLSTVSTSARPWQYGDPLIELIGNALSFERVLPRLTRIYL